MESNKDSMFFGTILTLLITLTLGAYMFTWAVMNNEQIEKREWREKHIESIDKKFDEVRTGQKELSDTINRRTDEMTELIKKVIVLEEKYKSKNGGN